MLEYASHVPEDAKDGAPVMVLLHGRGSHKGDWMGLRPYLLPGAIVVTPQAPFSGAELGYGSGWAWYRFLGGTRPDPDTFLESQNRLHRFLEALPDLLGVKPGPLILGGFSQGATMSTAYTLLHPGRVPFVLHFSGFLADHPSVRPTPETVQGTAYFWGHGTRDFMVPFALAEEGRRRLREAGARLEARDYPVGHTIDPQELEDAMTWLRCGLEEKASGGPS